MHDAGLRRAGGRPQLRLPHVLASVVARGGGSREPRPRGRRCTCTDGVNTARSRGASPPSAAIRRRPRRPTGSRPWTLAHAPRRARGAARPRLRCVRRAGRRSASHRRRRDRAAHAASSSGRCASRARPSAAAAPTGGARSGCSPALLDSRDSEARGAGERPRLGGARSPSRRESRSSSPRSSRRRRRERDPARRRAGLPRARAPHRASCWPRSPPPACSPRSRSCSLSRYPHTQHDRAAALERERVIVLDLSASISSDTFSRIGGTLRVLSRSGGRFGLVIFSDEAYEALPPGTPAADLAPFVRYFTLPQQARPGFAVTSRSTRGGRRSRGGTKISAGMDLAHSIAVASPQHATVVLVSDLDDNPSDLRAGDGAAVVPARQGAGADRRAEPVRRSDLALFQRLLPPGSAIVAAPTLVAGAAARPHAVPVGARRADARRGGRRARAARGPGRRGSTGGARDGRSVSCSPACSSPRPWSSRCSPPTSARGRPRSRAATPMYAATPGRATWTPSTRSGRRSPEQLLGDRDDVAAAPRAPALHPRERASSSGLTTRSKSRPRGRRRRTRLPRPRAIRIRSAPRRRGRCSGS